MTGPPKPGGGDRLVHFVAPEPFDPHIVEALTPEQERFYMASQWRMMWWRFRRHRLAVASGLVLLAVYASIMISEIVAPYNLHSRNIEYIYAPPQSLHLFHEGRFVGPFVYGLDYQLNMTNLKREYTDNPRKILPVRYFCSGDVYEFWGLFKASFHLICPAKGGVLFLFGTDRLGRDMLSRVIMGARISLTVGLFGIAISFILGMVIGGLAGYYGGWIDGLLQMITDAVRTVPAIPLFMALAAFVPDTWSAELRFLFISCILGLIGWPTLARRVRTHLLTERSQEYVLAAQLCGASPGHIIRRHLLPSFTSYIIIDLVISFPFMVLSETALSFIGLGLKDPVNSLGVMLQNVSKADVLLNYQWHFIPVIFFVALVLAFVFVGDGLRDAADPYASTKK